MNYAVMLVAATVGLIGATAAAASPDPSLVGRWTFTGTATETTGNWSTLSLNGSAAVEGTGLKVRGGNVGGNGANAATAWALASGYSGPTIHDKTLVTFITLDDLAHTSGAGIGLYTPTYDQFDSVVYGEAYPGWLAGSDYFNRTSFFNNTDVSTGNRRTVAFTYHDTGLGYQTITGYLNGTQIGQYNAGILNFGANAEVVFGARHLANGSTPIGSLDAHIKEDRVYNRALSAAEIGALGTVPEPASWAMMLVGFGSLGAALRAKRRAFAVAA